MSNPSGEIFSACNAIAIRPGHIVCYEGVIYKVSEAGFADEARRLIELTLSDRNGSRVMRVIRVGRSQPVHRLSTSVPEDRKHRGRRPRIIDTTLTGEEP